MQIIQATFREVDSEIFNQLEQAIQQTDARRFATINQIRRMKRRAVAVLKRRAARLRSQLNDSALRQLEAERKVMQEELTRTSEQRLKDIQQEAQKVLLDVLRETIGRDARLVSGAALHRLSLLFTLLSRQRGLSITFNPVDFADKEIRQFCAEREISAVSQPGCPPGDFLINLPSGTIESSLSDDLENLAHHFGSRRNGDAAQHV